MNRLVTAILGAIIAPLFDSSESPFMKEATARIKINKLLEVAGWRFFADANGPANFQLEPRVSV